MTFLEHSKQIVEDYLGTVAYVDDLIFSSIEEVKPKSLGAIDVKATAAEVVVKEDAKLPKVENPRQLRPNIDPLTFTNAFLGKGIHCALLEITNEKDSLDPIKKTLKKSDVIILDWQMHGDLGEKATKLLLSVLEDNNSGLRLIIIYTENNDYANILEESIIPTLKKNSITEGKLDATGCRFLNGHTKITVLKKENGTKTDTSISVLELPEKIIEEFVEMTLGLVSNTTLKAVSVIRENTNKLLAVFHKELDPAFLTNRSLLANESDANPEDADVLLRDTILDSIHNLVSSAHISEHCSIEQIEKWLNENKGYTKEEVTIENIKYKLDNETRLKLVEKGVSDAEAYFCKTHNLKGNITKTEKTILKNNPIEYLMPKIFKRGNLNEEFAILTHQITNFQGDSFVPALSFGSVVRNNKKYYLCIQPPCDTLRIAKGEKKGFLFIELELNEDKNHLTRVLVWEKDGYIKLKPNLKSHEIKVFKFQETKNGQVSAVKKIFSSSTHRMKFEWICDLKKDHAQRIVNELAATISRVGINESEWIRIN